MRRPLPVLLGALAALALAACGGDDDSPDVVEEVVTEAAPTGPAQTAPAQATTPPAATGTTIKVAGSQVGDVLFDGDDQAIYIFDLETDSTPRCYDDCAAEWPPVITEGEPQAGSGARAGLLGTTRRTDGRTQVTYGGKPLYYYAHEGPGELRCHNVPGFGGLWLALQTDGTVPA